MTRKIIVTKKQMKISPTLKFNFFSLLTLACTWLPLTAEIAPDGGKADLRDSSKLPEVQKELAEPDGVSIQFTPDGGWKIFARGSGTYDFNDADEIRGATQDATLRAKEAIASFLKERLQSKKGMENVSEKIKNLSVQSTPENNSQTQASISKTDVQTRVEKIVSSADAILKGVIVLESVKTPVGSGGTVQVTVGISSKTQLASDALRSGNLAPSDSPGASNHSPTKPGTLTDKNTPETKKSKTDF